MIECCDLCPVISPCALVEKQLKVFLFPITSLDVLLVSEYTARDGNANDHLTAQCKINAHHFMR